MFGLAAGKILSLIIEGLLHWLIVVYLLLELGFGTIGLLLIKNLFNLISVFKVS